MNTASLLALLALTLAVGALQLGAFKPAVALGIAVLKAMLVGLYFMHLRYARPITRLFACAALFWLTVLIVLTLTDALTRGWGGFLGPV